MAPLSLTHLLFQKGSAELMIGGGARAACNIPSIASDLPFTGSIQAATVACSAVSVCLLSNSGQTSKTDKGLEETSEIKWHHFYAEG